MKKTKQVRLLLFIALLIFIVGCATTSGMKETSQAAPTGEVMPEITDIVLQDNSLSIKGNSQFAYTMYSPDDPYKIIVDIPDMTFGKMGEKIVSDKAGIAEITPQQMDSPVKGIKLLIALQNPSKVIPIYKENTLTLMIKAEEPVALAKAEDIAVTDIKESAVDVKEPVQPEHLSAKAIVEEKAPIETSPPQGSSAKAGATVITGVDLNKSPDGVKVHIAGNGTMMPNVFPLDDRIVVDIPNVTLNAQMPSGLISPLKGIRAGKHKDKVRLVLDLKGKTNYDVTAIGSSIIISLQKTEPVTAAEPLVARALSKDIGMGKSPSELPPAEPERAPESRTNDKRRISLDFQDADIVPIFRLIADISGYNIVVNPDVKGKITLKLINVPWDQALDIILRTFSLSKIVDGNVIRIVPTNIVSKEHEDLARAKKAQSESGDLKTRIFPVNYADLGKLRDAIEKSKVLSSRGSLSLDERGSSIIINDLEPNLELIDALIKDIDKEHMQARQVVIEAKIIEINSNYAKDLGIQWGAGYTKPGGSGTTIIGGSGLLGTGISATNSLVNLPSSAVSGAIGIGYISKLADFALDLQLSAMEQLDKGKIISSPKIMTMNNENAKISQGQKRQLPSTDKDGNVTFKEVPIFLTLDVTPRIAPGGGILMKISITKDDFVRDLVFATAVGVETSNNIINTSVLVNNGDTIVIGGIYKQSRADSEASVPGLSKIPILGRLFKKDSEKTSSTELMVFITPKVVEFSALQ